MIAAGLDIGSVSTESVIINSEGSIIVYDIIPTGFDSKEASENSLNNALKSAKLQKKDIGRIVSTGYGRNNVAFADKAVTEITCHAVGARFLFKETRTILDIGGQDSKAISLDSSGKVIDFAMNDKCAAGTGRFLELMAKVLDADVASLAKLALKAKKKVRISNICGIFAESEVISLIHEGFAREDIARGIHDSVADRALALLRKVSIVGPVTLTGGVIKNEGVVRALKNKLGEKLFIPPEPQIVGALGAAIIAADSVLDSK